jgi:hypothetical protein
MPKRARGVPVLATVALIHRHEYFGMNAKSVLSLDFFSEFTIQTVSAIDPFR